MSRERRSLWKNISTSIKVNAISLKAALVYTWAIPHFDDEGYQDGDPRILKGKIVPLQDEISVDDLEKIVQELVQIGLWVIHKANRNVFIQDPVFSDYQTFHGVRKKPSKIKELLDRTSDQHQPGTNTGVDTVQDRFLSEEKGSEEKGSEEKGNPTGIVDNILQLFRKNCPNLPQPRELNRSRVEKIRTRLKEHQDLEWWREVFKKADRVSFTGKDGKEWRPSFDWLIENDKNAVKVIEGNYEQKSRTHSGLRRLDERFREAIGKEEEIK